MQRRLSRRSFFRGVGALGAMALAGRQLDPKANEPTPLQAAGAVADWPEWRGRGRLGVWTESGILDRFPAQGLQGVWRTPVHSGYAGPAVAGQRRDVVGILEAAAFAAFDDQPVDAGIDRLERRGEVGHDVIDDQAVGLERR